MNALGVVSDAADCFLVSNSTVLASSQTIYIFTAFIVIPLLMSLLQLPPRVDFLYVEQEVLADGTSAVDAVLKADK